MASSGDSRAEWPWEMTLSEWWNDDPLAGLWDDDCEWPWEMSLSEWWNHDPFADFKGRSDGL